MTTREKILQFFEENRGTYFSGEDLAKNFGVSRTAIWKAVQILREEGYAVEGATKKGYCMPCSTDILSPQGIQKYLVPSKETWQLCVLSTVDSTNTVLREKANQGCSEGYVILSGEQTAGRGRYGREFFSPADSGLYLSFLVKPSAYTAERAVRLTTMAAVAVCEAIREVSEEEPQIKWVNDIFVRGKKVCGILTEASFSMESGFLDYAVVGIGINIYHPKDGFPDMLQTVAGAVFDQAQNDMKNHLAASLLNHFASIYDAPESQEYIQKYRRYSLVLGKNITIHTGMQERSAYVYDMDDACRLLVRYADGKTECLSHGEISIRL